MREAQFPARPARETAEYYPGNAGHGHPLARVRQCTGVPTRHATTVSARDKDAEFVLVAAARALRWRPPMRWLLLVATFAALSVLSLGGCQLQLGADCDSGRCNSDCLQNCPPPDLGDDGSTFVPPTPPASCPLDADRICSDGYRYSCANGVVTSTFYSCRPGTTCVETATRDGRRAAACATGDDACVSDAPVAAECRGDDRIACEYGLVVLRSPCPASNCAVSATTDDYPSASCVLVN